MSHLHSTWSLARVSLTRNALYYHLSNGSLDKVVDTVDLEDMTTIGRFSSRDLTFLSNLNYSVKESPSGVLRLSVAPSLAEYSVAVYPVVEFDAQPGKRYVIGYWSTPISITQEEEKLSGELKLYSVPLRIAFALTAHRMQGGTVPIEVTVRIQLEDAFMPELIYVALSRIRSVQQLVVTTPPQYSRFYGQTARQTMCPHAKRFLAVQTLRLNNYLLQREANETERRLIEKEFSRKQATRALDARPSEKGATKRSRLEPAHQNQPNLEICWDGGT